jgi:hypothetical protein
MGKITERVSHPDDPIYREGLRMYSVRLGPRPGDPEVAEIFGAAQAARADGRADGEVGEKTFHNRLIGIRIFTIYSRDRLRGTNCMTAQLSRISDGY